MSNWARTEGNSWHLVLERGRVVQAAALVMTVLNSGFASRNSVCTAGQRTTALSKDDSRCPPPRMRVLCSALGRNNLVQLRSHERQRIEESAAGDQGGEDSSREGASSARDPALDTRAPGLSGNGIADRPSSRLRKVRQRRARSPRSVFTCRMLSSAIANDQTTLLLKSIRAMVKQIFHSSMFVAVGEF
jgi:hypothetical protein